MSRYIGKLRFGTAQFTPATGSISYTNGTNAVATQTVILGTQTYTFRAALAAANDILIGASADASYTNLVAAINRSAGEGSTYGTGTGANVSATAAVDTTADKVTLTARDTSVGGNTVALSTTAAGATASGATLTGGAPIVYIDGKPESQPSVSVSGRQIFAGDVLVLAITASGDLSAERSGVTVQDYA